MLGEDGLPLSIPVALNGVEQEHEDYAWRAMRAARRMVNLDSRQPKFVDGVWRAVVQEWQYRGAPSPGARAVYILHDMVPREIGGDYMRKCEQALRLYLSDEDMTERPGTRRHKKGRVGFL